MPTKKTMSPRDKARWAGIAAGAACMIAGVFFPVPLTVWEKRVTDNAFLFVGVVTMLLTFGVVQLVKAWRGNKDTAQ
jgi:hypothetical protein